MSRAAAFTYAIDPSAHPAAIEAQYASWGLTSGICVAWEVYNLIPDVEREQVIVLPIPASACPNFLNWSVLQRQETDLGEGIDRTRILIQQIRSPSRNTPIDTPIQRQTHIQPTATSLVSTVPPHTGGE
jgi:hypothetical protein